MIFWLLWLEAPRRDLGALYFFVVVPIVSYILLNGFETIGMFSALVSASKLLPSAMPCTTALPPILLILALTEVRKK